MILIMMFLLKPFFSGLTVDNMMKFATEALAHTAGEVRQKAESIIIMLYRDVGAPIKDYLPTDGLKTRKNVLYKQIFNAFDKLDGKNTATENVTTFIISVIALCFLYFLFDPKYF